MGKGGGGGQPTSTTAYQTNLPEYAKPYVMNMLGAAQNQLFTTTPGTVDPKTGETTPGEITGFKPYTPYSTDPTKYFAGPTGLQQQVYGEAAGMQTPGAYGAAQGLAGAAGLGQFGTAQQAGRLGQMGLAGAMPAFGAGQQYASQVTNPNAVSQYMSPYMQNVVDTQKAAAVREAQIANQTQNLASARSGTYGGARQALASAERERGLLSNLANIQAQGSQNAYNQALQNMQYGANLGLQGISTGLQGVSTGLQGLGAQQAGYAGAGAQAQNLANIAGTQQQADLARMGFQQQTGAAQQQYQQNIINQAIQDYATAQQYPYMQLSTMSNLLRGLPMQSMSTQQYQAQPSTTQQLLGLAGTGASLYGAFGRKEGGEIKEYKAGGIADDMRSKLEAMADADPQGLKRLVAKSSSKEVRDMGNEILSGIAMANAGKLGTNMAGGGIVAFQDGGLNDPMGLQSDSQPGYGFSVSSLGDILGALGTEEEWQKALRLKRHGIQYEPPKGFDKEGLPIGSRFSKESKSSVPTAAETAAFTETPGGKTTTAGTTTAGQGGDGTTGAGAGAGAGGAGSPVGLEGYLAQRKKLLGVDGPGEKSQALMKALEERQAGLTKEADSDRYLRAAEAFAKFGSTAGPMLKGASEALGGFAKGESMARKEQDKIKLEGMKMQSDLEKAQRAEARGDLDAAEKFYNSAQDRANRIEVAQIGASATGQTARFEKEAVERVMADKGVDFATALQIVRGAGRQESVELQGAKASLDYIKNRLTFLDPKKDAEEIKKLKAAESQILGQLNKSGGTSGGGKPSVTNW